MDSPKRVRLESRSDDVTIQQFSIYSCKFSENIWKPAQVLKIERNKEGERYYVHFKDTNARNDKWVVGEEIDMSCLLDGCSNTHEAEHLVTRNQKRRSEKNLDVVDVEERDEKEREKVTRIKNINEVQFGELFMNAWYYSPFPEEYSHQQTLFICSYCLLYHSNEFLYWKHFTNCEVRSPPGKRIYHKDDLSVYEIDSSKQKFYCQKLCLLAKLFLDHKTLFYDVEPFLFYVLIQKNRTNFETIGYFSKERESPDNNNVACIIVLPPFQRKSFGKFLISFSYELSKIEKKSGSPEKPLSDLGRKSYLSYWKQAILDCLKKEVGTISLDEISERTSISHSDILVSLKAMRITCFHNVTSKQFRIDSKTIRNLLCSHHYKPLRLKVDLKHLRWNPVLTSPKSSSG